MNSIKNAIVTITLLAVGYGAYVVLHNPPPADFDPLADGAAGMDGAGDAAATASLSVEIEPGSPDSLASEAPSSLQSPADTWVRRKHDAHPSARTARHARLSVAPKSRFAVQIRHARCPDRLCRRSVPARTAAGHLRDRPRPCRQFGHTSARTANRDFVFQRARTGSPWIGRKRPV